MKLDNRKVTPLKHGYGKYYLQRGVSWLTAHFLNISFIGSTVTFVPVVLQHLLTYLQLFSLWLMMAANLKFLWVLKNA